MKRAITLLLSNAALFASLQVPPFLSADFNQTVTNADHHQTLHYQGHLMAALPNMAKWIYQKPLKKTICLQQTKVWVIEPLLEQATIYRLQQSIPVLQILKKAQKIDDRSYHATYQEIDYQIKTNPKGNLQSISYKDDLGNHVMLRFFNVSQKPIAKRAFLCKIPPNYDIIDARYR